EGGVDSFLNLRRRTKTDVQLDQRAAVSNHLLLDRFIERHVRAAKAIDRLLRVTDDEQLPWNRSYLSPLGFFRVISREQHQNLGLQRVRVLKLIDKYAGESGLQLNSHRCAIAHHIARAQQQIQKVQTPGAFLQPSVLIKHRRKLVPQPRREVRPRALDELLYSVFQRF